MIFWLITAMAGSGYLLALSASLWANVDRKRRELSILRLLGMKSNALVWFPIGQSLVTGMAGLVFATGAAALISWLLNRVFSESVAAGQIICRLEVQHILVAAIFTLFFATLSSVLAAYRIKSIASSVGVEEV